MKRLAKTLTIGLVTVLVVLCAASSYPAEDAKKPIISEFEGRVSYLNWVTSRMKVNGVGNMEFYIPRGTRISKLGSTIMLADINILDNVIIRYLVDEHGRNIAVSINVTVV